MFVFENNINVFELFHNFLILIFNESFMGFHKGATHNFLSINITAYFHNKFNNIRGISH